MNATLTFVMSCPIVKMHSWPLEIIRQKKVRKEFGSFELGITVNKVNSTMNLKKMQGIRIKESKKSHCENAFLVFGKFVKKSEKRIIWFIQITVEVPKNCIHAVDNK